MDAANDQPDGKPLDVKSVAAVVLGNALEFYDFITYSLFAKQIGEAYFPSSNPTVSLLSSLLVFWVGFFTRPLGAAIIGAYADRAGRKPAMLLTIVLMAVGMLMLAATPRFATIGWAAPAIVIAGRLIQASRSAARSGRRRPTCSRRRPCRSAASTPAGNRRARDWRSSSAA